MKFGYNTSLNIGHAGNKNCKLDNCPTNSGCKNGWEYWTGEKFTPTTNITIPLNSRSSDIQHAYIVGAANLDVYLNGQRLFVGDDYTEVGAVDSDSGIIQTQIDLVIGDVIFFKGV